MIPEIEDVTMEDIMANSGRLLVILALREMARDDYDAYLNTNHWNEVRRQEWARSRGFCVCGKRARDVHHISYENLGDERAGDVLAFCDPCHDRFHLTWHLSIRANIKL